MAQMKKDVLKDWLTQMVMTFSPTSLTEISVSV